MHNDGGNMLRVFQPFVNPCLAAVIGSINTVPKTNVTATHILSRTNPDHVRIGRVDRHVTDGVTTLFIEDRLPCDAGIAGFPYAT